MGNRSGTRLRNAANKNSSPRSTLTRQVSSRPFVVSETMPRSLALPIQQSRASFLDAGLQRNLNIRPPVMQKPALQRSALQKLPGAPQIQCFVMSNQQWMDKSDGVAGTSVRSAALLEIDKALWDYNKEETQLSSPSFRYSALIALAGKIQTWRQLKSQSSTKGKHRRGAVKKLADRVSAELHKLRSLTRPASLSNVGAVSFAHLVRVDIYKRVRQALRATLAEQRPKNPLKIDSQDKRLNIWNGLGDEAHVLLKDVRQKKLEMRNRPRVLPLIKDAVIQVQALACAVSEAKAISRYHLFGQQGGVQFSAFDIRSFVRLKGSLDYINHGKPLHDIDAITQDLAYYQAIAENSDGPAGQSVLDQMEGGLGNLATTTSDNISQVTGFSGYFGADGKGNEGLSEFLKLPPTGEGKADERAAAQKGVYEAFGIGLMGGRRGDLASGYSDATGAIADGINEAFAVGNAINVLESKDATSIAKAEAGFLLAKSQFATAAIAGKFGGGIATLIRGHAPGDQDTRGIAKGLKVGRWKTAEGTDISTDIKMAGDSASIVSNVFGFIGEVISFFKDFAQRDTKSKEGGLRRVAQFWLLRVKKFTGLLSSLAKSHSAVTKLAFQIKGGGQVAASDASLAGKVASGTAGPVKLVPALGMLMSVLDAVQSVGRLVRIGLRRTKITKEIKARLAAPSTGFGLISALELARKGLMKRTDRIFINIGHALFSIVAGGLNMSGIGSAPAMIINLASTALKIGQQGDRLVKQKARNWKARKRTKKGKSKTHAEWAFEQRYKAAKKGKFYQLLSELKIQHLEPNWDKSTKRKESDYQKAALEILEADNDRIYTALGIKYGIKKEPNNSKKLKIIVGALKKRD